MTRTHQPSGTKGFVKVLIASIILVALVFDGDLDRFALLPKRLVVQFAVLVLVSIVLRKSLREPVFFPRSPLLLPLLVYTGVNLLSISQAVNTVSAIESLSHLLTFLILFVVVAAALPRDALPSLVRSLAAVCILVSLIGIFEFWGVAISGIPSNGRPSSTFGYRNMAAAFLVVCIPLTVALVVEARTPRDLILGAASSSLMAVFLVYTRTRGAWVGLLLGVATAALFAFRARPAFGPVFRSALGVRCVAIATVAAIVLSVASPSFTNERSRHLDERKTQLLDALASSVRPGADRGRLAMWSHTVDMILDYPLLGVGAGNWAVAYPPYDGGDMIRAGSVPERPHNDTLWIAAETGALGLLAYLWVLLSTLVLVRKAVRHEATRSYGLAICASLTAFLGHGMFSFPRELPETSFIIFLWLGTLVAITASPSDRKGVRIPTSAWALTLVAAGLAGVLTAQMLRFDAQFHAAMRSNAGNDLRSTLQSASSAVAIGPFDARAFLIQGKGYQAVGDLRRAIEACERGLRYRPHSPELLGDLGLHHAVAGNLDLAESYFQRSLVLSPYQFQVQNNLGGIAQQRGQSEKAVGHFRKAIEVSEHYADAWSNLGIALTSLGRGAEAVEAIEQAISLAPHDPALYFDLGEAYGLLAERDSQFVDETVAAYGTFLRRWKNDDEAQREAGRRLDALRRQPSP